MIYFPSPDPASWHRAAPGETGLDPDAIAAAAQHASEHETPWSRDLSRMVGSDFAELPPWNETLGPVRARGGPNGLLLRNGLVVAEWGDTTRPDMTFSVAKSYLSILAGLAWDRGLIKDPHEKVRLTIDDGGFDPPHNDAITWHHLLQQTSEWEGTLWDKPDLVDRNRAVGGRSSAAAKGTHRDLRPPGAAHCPKCSASSSWIRSAPRGIGNGTATATPGSRSTAGGCNRCRAADIGAAGFSSAPVIRRGSG